jgi:hypothetical protein
MVISGLYPVDAERKALLKAVSDVRRLEAVSQNRLNEAQDDNERFREAYAAVLERVNFAPREDFMLNPAESADVQYFRIVSREREALVEWPKTQNITVAENLGMPDLSPTKRKDIQRALHGLDIVDRVVSLAIESNIQEVGAIELVPELRRRKKGFIEELKVRFEMAGSIGALAGFLERMQEMENYLALDSAELDASRGEAQGIAAEFVVSAMTVLQEEEE